MSKLFVGYDLGDGDTMVSRVVNGSIKDVLLPGCRTEGVPIPSIIGVDRGGVLRAGKSLLQMKTDGFSELSASFKRRPSTLNPTDLAQYADRVKKFTETLFSDPLFFKRAFVGDVGSASNRYADEAVVYVGHPTTWNEKDVALYRGFFEGSKLASMCREQGFRLKFRMVSESRAALLNFFNKDENKRKLRSQSAKGSFYVVVDFGSSTTDVTIIRKNADKYEIIADMGDANLGSRLIDAEIFRQMEDVLKDEGIELDEVARQKNLLRCREAKEIYFQTANSDDPNLDWQAVGVFYSRTFPLADHFCPKMLRDAMNAKSKSLGNRSYVEACRALFRRAADELDRGAKGFALFTGGPSRMPFLKEECESIFREKGLDGIQIILDSEPSSAISRGLAECGRADEERRAFLAEIDEYCRTKIPGILSKNSRDLANRFATGAIPPLCEIVLAGFRKWRAGDCQSLQDMESYVDARLRSYLTGEDAKKLFDKIAKEWISEIARDEIDKDVCDICRKYDVAYAGQIALIANRIANPNVNVNASDLCGNNVERQLAAALTALVLSLSSVIALVLIPTTISVLLALVYGLAALITTILTGTIVFLFGTCPPLYPVALALIGASAVLAIIKGKKWVVEKSRSKVKTANLPMLLRNRVDENDVVRDLKSKEWEMKRQIADSIQNDAAFQGALEKEVGRSVGEFVASVADSITVNLY